MQKNSVKALLAVALGVTACGQDNGYLYRPQNVQFMDQPAAPQAFALAPIHYNQVTWYYDCVDPNAPTPAATMLHELVITGPGPHPIPRARMTDTPIVFKGRVCPARVYNRDIVVGVSLSGSLDYSDNSDALDPATNTCRRLQALRQIANNLPAGARISAFSFDENQDVLFNTGFVDNANDLFSAIVRQSTAESRRNGSAYNGLNNGTTPLGDIDTAEKAVCFVLGGLPSFQNAANRGKATLESGRADDTKKELILLTDDYGASGSFNRTNTLFNNMKNTGVTAAGQTIPVKVGIVDVGLRATASQQSLTQFASLANNQPIYSSNNAAQVTNSMSEFARNELLTSTFQYGEIGATNLTSIDARPFIQANASFEMPAAQFAQVTSVQTGYVVKYDSTDTHGNTHTFEGKIEWTDF